MTTQQKIEWLAGKRDRAEAELARAYPHGPSDARGYRDRLAVVEGYGAELALLGAEWRAENGEE